MNSEQRRRKIKTYLKDALVITVFFIAAAVLVNIYKSWDIDTDVVHELQVTTIDDEKINLRQYRGRPVLVQFWANWCPVCSLGYGSWNSLATDYPVITIAMNSGSIEELKAYRQEHDLSFAIVADPDGEIADRWQVSGVPTSFFLDRAGRIEMVEVGYTSEIGMRARLWLAGQ